MRTLPEFLLFLGKLVVTACLLLLVTQGIDVHGAQTRIASAATSGLVVALAFAVLQVVLGTWRWIVVTDILCGVRISMAHATGVAGLGLLSGQVLPSTVGGDVVRVGFIARIAGVGPGTRCVIADRAFGVLALGALALLSTGWLAWSGLHDAALLVPAGLAFALIGTAALLVAFAPRRERLPAWMAALAAPASDLRLLFRHRRAPLVILLSVAAHLPSIATFMALALAISFDEVSLTTLALFVSPALLISALPVSIGGWGLRESAFSVGLATVGAVGEGPVVLSVLFGLTTIAASIVASLGWFSREARILPSRERP